MTAPRLLLKDRQIDMQPGETVLAALRRSDVATLYSCESGYCHGCILRGVGKIPAEAQKGLSPDLQECGCFLACRCVPTEDMRVFFPGEKPTA
jgi:ferredoxin